MRSIQFGLLIVVVTSSDAAAAPMNVNCGDDQWRQLQEAVRVAHEFAGSCERYMREMVESESGAYEKWFGPARSNMMEMGCHTTTIEAGERVARVKTNVTNIWFVLEYRDLFFDCSTSAHPDDPRSCVDPTVIAYVVRDQTMFKTIYLCAPFWKLGTSGYDSKAGALVHEISHFTDVADTRDLRKCNVLDCPGYAANSPDEAIQNAYNYGYFAESRPAENPKGCLIGRRGARESVWVIGLYFGPLALLALRRLSRSRRSGNR